MQWKSSAFVLFGILCPIFLSAQAIVFQDSVFIAPAYKPAGLDPMVQQRLDGINNQELDSNQRRRFLRHCFDEVNAFKRTSNYGNTYFENEKASYPMAMHSLIWGLGLNNSSFIQPAKAFLQSKAIYDLGSDLTDTVDFFPSFTLKGQVPKYFYFGKYLGILDAAYLEKMRSGMYKWTHSDTLPTDPLLRPNPYFLGNSGCWDVRCRNSWVDSRNTDNLKAMRETSAYLFAEEINNEPIRQLYFNRLNSHVAALWHVGYSEWDSETYVPHAIGPFYNLFAFTPNPRAKSMGKAALDWYYMAASLKYFHGMSVGPSKRSNAAANVRLGGGSPDMPYLYFGETKVPESEIFDRDRDGYIAFLSDYRPPQALFQLASKQFRLPVEIRASKPSYGTFTPNAFQPDAFETMYFGKTFQMGSVISAAAVNDMRPFKLGAFHPSRGADVFYANTTDEDTLSHAKYLGDQIGQYENLLVFVRKGNNRKFFFQLPVDIPFDSSGGLWFFQYAKTWIGLRPLNLTVQSVSPLNGIYAGHKKILCQTPQNGFSGFAIEVVDDSDYPSFEDFKSAFASRPFDVAHFSDSGKVRIEGKNGKFLVFKHNSINQRPTIFRNSPSPTSFANQAEYGIYRSVTPPSVSLLSVIQEGSNLNVSFQAKDSIWGPVLQNWRKGIVKILTNDHYFEGKYDANSGAYHWKELPATADLKKGKIARFELFANGQLVYSNTDSVFLNQETQSLSIPFSLSGTFDFQAQVWDEEGNAAQSNLQSLAFTARRDKIKSEQFQVQPNPASDELTIRVEAGMGRFTIFQSDGKVIKTLPCDNPETQISVRNLNSGVYFIQWQSDRHTLIKPFIKN